VPASGLASGHPCQILGQGSEEQQVREDLESLNGKAGFEQDQNRIRTGSEHEPNRSRTGSEQESEADAQSIAKALEVDKTLEDVWSWENRIGNVGARALAEVLKVKTALEDIQLDRQATSAPSPK